MTLTRGLAISIATAALAFGMATLYFVVPAARHQAVSSPVAHFSRMEHDFGVVVPEDALETAFELCNRGNASLVIKGISASCGCTHVKATAETVAPGESTFIKVSFRPATVGPLTHVIAVDTNDPVNSRTMLSVKCKAEWPIEVYPVAIHVPNIVCGVEREYRVEVFSRTDNDFSVECIKSTSPGITIAKKSSDGGRHVFVLHVKCESIGRIEEEIEFVTDCPKRPIITVRIRGNAIGNSDVSPSHVLLGERVGGSVVKLEMTVNASGAPEEVRAIRCGSEWSVESFSVHINDAGVRQLLVLLRVPLREGFHRGNLELEIGARTVQVPVSCLVSSIKD